MGKYMKKTKPSGEAAAMESSTTIGVRTRARTLALLQTKQDSAYLELRSRRLEKPTPNPPTPKSKPPNPNPRADRTKKEHSKEQRQEQDEEDDEAAEEVSFFGENFLEAEPTDRSYRETTPCSMIRNPETMGTPGSTTRQKKSNSANRRTQSSMHRNVPTSHEIEEFFAVSERLQQRTFAEKYNFDPANDCPLPGRYEWAILD